MNHKTTQAFAYVFSAAIALSSIGCSTTTPRTYQGSAQGRNGEVSVEITYDNETIQSVKITKQNETEEIAEPALSQIPVAIVNANTPYVDSVSGATVTSEAIKNAVSRCRFIHI